MPEPLDFRCWVDSRYHFLYNLLPFNKFKTLQHLQETKQIPIVERYRYLQIQHYVHTLLKCRVEDEASLTPSSPGQTVIHADLGEGSGSGVGALRL